MSTDLDALNARIAEGIYGNARADAFHALDALVAEVERLRAEVEHLRGEADRECVAVLNYLTYRIEMSHYADAIDEFINAHHEISEGIHRTLDYDELLP
jgi:hypothetical protein